MAKTKRRKPLSKKDPNVVASMIPISEEEEEDEDVAVKKEERSRRVKEVFVAIDREVKARIAAIKTITDAQVSAIVLQLETVQRKFSDEMLDMPLSEFLRKHCPNTEAEEKEGGIVELRKKPHAESKSLEMLLPTEANSLPSESVKEMLLKSVEIHLAGETQRQADAHKTQKLDSRETALESSSLRTPHMGWRTAGKALVTPKTVRLPKPGETLLSLNGSPLGVYGSDKITSVSEIEPTRAKRILRSCMKAHTNRAV